MSDPEQEFRPKRKNKFESDWKMTSVMRREFRQGAASTVDKGTPEGKKKTKKDKPYVYERRYIGEDKYWFGEEDREWTVKKRFTTKRGRDDSFNRMIKLRKDSIFWSQFEFRIPEEGAKSEAI